MGKTGLEVRFTPDKPGRWCVEGVDQCIEVQNSRPEYAKGFVSTTGTKWIRSATKEAFVPQYLMYDKPDINSGIKQFVHQHGFTGFHLQNLRDFLENPEYFEAVVLKTYRAGGVTHFWLWGDEDRGQTPKTYGVDTNHLYHEIAARLSPLPGWTLGYGFDLYEWAESEEISKFRKQLNELTSYPHLIGARGRKNEYQEMAKDLDYASWEWHRPDYSDYRDHIIQAGGRPAFSEDRFRVRDSKIHQHKDYDFTATRRGLWRSLFAGGVANIWGYRSKEGAYSSVYPNHGAIRCYKDFTDRTYHVDTKVVPPVLEGAYCLKPKNNSTSISCYLEQVKQANLLISPEDILDIRYLNTKSCSGGQTSLDQIMSTKIEFLQEADWVVTLVLNSQNSDAQPSIR
ncbi:hypothetical protein MSSD14B_38290 [Marinobacter salsuginis]|uniref:Uncharacterized protein n=2 Tax=Marinobacter salsuginis TaxID=418719 RepID=A0A5M3Q525_9GAMM|nr:hypothetical protein MSSD14B_38290 [Marinobacter salsuginis]